MNRLSQTLVGGITAPSSVPVSLCLATWTGVREDLRSSLLAALIFTIEFIGIYWLKSK